MRLAHGLAFLSLLVGCQVATPGETVTDAAIEPLVTSPEAHVKPKHRVEITQAAWPTTEADRSVVAEMTSDARATLPSAVVPVLMPSSAPKSVAELTRNATLMTKPTFVAWSSFADDRSLTVSLSSSVVVHQHAEVRAAQPTSTVRNGKPAWVLQNEGIWSVAWEEFSVWYVVELECSRPGEDTRCKDDTAVREIVEGLRFVGPEVSR